MTETSGPRNQIPVYLQFPGPEVAGFFWAGLQKVGTAGTAGAGQITFGWTK